MRAIAILFPLLLGASFPTSQEMIANFPDIRREHHIRFNCHNAFDYLAAENDAGRPLSDAHFAWSNTHFDLGSAGKACARPPEDLADRVTNRKISTSKGISMALKFAKQSKDASASTELAHAIFTGKIKNFGNADAIELLQMGAEGGDPDANFVVGTLYAAGMIGGKSDLVTAFARFDRAAKSGHVDAIFRKALFLKEGYGVKANPALAFASFKEAAGRGHLYAAIMTIAMLHEGSGTKQNFEQAYTYSRNLAAKGEPMGAFFAALSIGRAKNAIKRKVEIYYWLDEASRMGNDQLKSFVVQVRGPIEDIFNREEADRAAARAAARAYVPRPWKSCPTKDYCTINHFTGVKSCNTVPDYTADCGMQ